jgi:haloacetate dehalogenase
MASASESSSSTLTESVVHPQFPRHLFPGFEHGVKNLAGQSIPYLKGGSGPALLLLHGHPQTRVIWHKVAQKLAQNFTVVATDLRGYGDASKPAPVAEHINYSKRAMARDQVDLMAALGFHQFDLVGHDRGGRVAHRLAVDFPEAVRKVVVLDIAPTLAMYEQTNQAFATAYWHWFFLIQPAPFPETLISADPEFYLKKLMGNRHAGLGPFLPEAFAEYVRCLRQDLGAMGTCEDYRAAAGIDLQHDRADREVGRRVQAPLMVLWGQQGVIQRCFQPLHEWRRVAADVQGKALPCGHYIPEEAPQELLAELERFFN